MSEDLKALGLPARVVLRAEFAIATRGSVTATNIVWADNVITATVPANANTGFVTVTVGGVASTNNPTFTVNNVFVNSVSPQAGPANTPITISGSGFGSSGTLQINNAPVSTSTWSNTQITANVPSGATSGAIKVTAGGVSSNTSVTFTVSNVSVNSVIPTSGPRTGTVQINGSGFGGTKGNSTVTIGGVTATTGTWSDSAITATVPTSASTGPVVVTVGGAASNSTISFTVTSPIITSITPSSGAAGTPVQIRGSGFGTSGTLTFSGPGATAVNPTWTDTLISATVPSTTTSGRVFVSVNGLFSNLNLNFTVPNAVITSISPTSGAANTQVTINGSGFGVTQGSNTVTFNGVTIPQADIMQPWSDTQVVVTVPPSIRTGPVVVNAATTTNKDVVFTMPNPIVTSVTPASGPTNTPVQISGSGFGATQGSSTVTFNGQAGQNITWSDTVINATVPSTASSGVVTVSVGGVPSTSTINYVVPPPIVTSMTPNRGLSGIQVTVNGSNFQPSPGNNNVFLENNSPTGSAIAPWTTWSDSQIVATVPANTLTGPASVKVNGVFSNSDVGFTLTSPRVTGLAPAIATVNTPIHINGSGFGDTQGASSVQISGNVASITSWSDTQIIATVPTAAKSGAVVVFVSGISSNNNVNLTVPAPQITSISPATGIVGSTVTITGSGFQTNRGSGTVIFTNGASPNTFVSWSDTQIVLAVPSGATSGAVSVSANNGALSNQDQIFTMPNPIVSSLSPASGPTGTQVQANGVGFGGSQSGNSITFGGVPASVVTWSDTQIVAFVPLTANSGAVQVTEGGVVGNATVFFNVPAPTITSIGPAAGGSGNPITITGTGFQAAQGSSSYVTFSSGGSAGIKSWSDTQIVAVVPAQTTTGFLSVTVNSTPSNYVDYAIPNQTISSIAPTTGPVGTQVTVNGTAFGSSQGTSVLSFNGQAAAVSSWTNTQIVATVPDTSATGPAVVTIAGTNSNTALFTVPAPNVGNLQPNGGVPGTTVTINGSGFQANQRDSTVTFNGTPATVTSWSDTQILASVPTGASTGPLLVHVNSVASQNNALSLFEVPNPVIASISPSEAPAGGTITITGSGFGPGQSYSPDGVSVVFTGFIYFNGVQVSAQSWSDTTLVTTVPSGASSGSITVKQYDATSNAMPQH